MNSRDQFFQTVRKIILIICPEVRYDQGKNYMSQLVITVKDEDDDVVYMFRFNNIENSIVFQMDVMVDEEPKRKEINWKIGSKSIQAMIDEIREEKSKLQKKEDGPFAGLNKLRT